MQLPWDHKNPGVTNKANDPECSLSRSCCYYAAFSQQQKLFKNKARRDPQAVFFKLFI